jgi:creatinine amidohydrolase
MLPHELIAARDAKPVAYLPVGRLEWHGRHLAWGNDAVKAHAMCVRMAEAIGGVVYPALYYGDDPTQIADLHFPNGEQISSALGVDRAKFTPAGEGWQWPLYQDLLKAIFWEIERYGFRVLVVLTGHYPLKGPARQAAEAYMAQPEHGLKILAMIGVDQIADLGFKGDHAAKWETSALMALRPDLVEMSRLDGREDPPLGVMGEDPRQASAAHFEEGMKHIIERVRAQVEEALV